MESKKDETIKLRRDKQKKLVLERLRKTPIVQIACSQSGISRATYYCWITKDKRFQKNTNKAIRAGELFINDLSESQIITLIKEKKWSAIRFWLTNHHPKYTNKLEVTTNIKQEELNEEQETTVRNALKLAFPVLPQKQNDKSDDKQPDTKPAESSPTS